MHIRVSGLRRSMRLRAIEFKGGKCSRCGYVGCAEAFDFHHRDPSQKDFQISSGNTKNWDSVVAELEKCDLLCANCHRTLHSELRAESRSAQQAFLMQGKAALAVQRGLRALEKAPLYRLKPDPNNARGTKILWPDRETLEKMVRELSALKTAKILGVSDSAVGDRCRMLGIPTNKRGQWAKKQKNSRIGSSG